MSIKRSDQWVLLGMIALVLFVAWAQHLMTTPKLQMERFILQVSEPLDLNRATFEELIALPGVGPVLAQRIIEYRQAHDAFKSVEELLKVRGIGPKKLAQLRERVRVGSLENSNPVR